MIKRHQNCTCLAESKAVKYDNGYENNIIKSVLNFFHVLIEDTKRDLYNIIIIINYYYI